MTWAVWITGLPGSGKTVIAEKVRRILEERGIVSGSVKVLELDEIRRFITPQPTYSDDERELVYASLVYMAKLLVENGKPVIIDATGNRRRYRERARETITKFAEVYVRCSLETCMERERRRKARYAPPGIYNRAMDKGARVPGVNVPYEEPTKPEVVVDSETMSVKACAEKVVAFIQKWYER
ncbi:MAG: adenylyl-sulfate kinase [Candidatus Methanospirareceae archaeon]